MLYSCTHMATVGNSQYHSGIRQRLRIPKWSRDRLSVSSRERSDHWLTPVARWRAAADKSDRERRR